MDGYEDMSIERMLEIVTQLSVVSEEDRERLRHLLIERTGSANIPDESTGLPPSMDPAGGPSNYADSKARLTYDPTEHEYYLFFATMAFVIGIIALVGYTLYRTLTARERRRYERQMSRENKSRKKK